MDTPRLLCIQILSSYKTSLHQKITTNLEIRQFLVRPTVLKGNNQIEHGFFTFRYRK